MGVLMFLSRLVLPKNKDLTKLFVNDDVIKEGLNVQSIGKVDIS